MSIVDIPAPTRIGSECNGMRLSAGEYDAIEDWEAGYRYELVNGVLIVSPPAAAGERGPNDELGYLLRTYQETHASGQVIDDTLPEQEIRTGDNRRRADRAIWVGLGRTPIPLRDVPSIAVEFVSRSRRDWRREYVEKRHEYAEAGVAEYWVIDRFRRELTVFRGADQEVVILKDETYTTDLLPGFELSMDRLLTMADRYRESDS